MHTGENTHACKHTNQYSSNVHANTHQAQSIEVTADFSHVTFTHAHAHIQRYVHPLVHTTVHIYKHAVS